GAVLGAVTSLALVGRARLVPVMLAAALVAAGAFVVLGLAISTVLAFIVAAVTGMSRSLMEVSGRTLLQRVTSTELLARVFSFKDGLSMAAWGIGSVSIPIVIAIAGLRGALFFTGAIVPVIILLRFRPLHAVDAAAVIPAVTIALVRSVDIFRALPVTALEGVAQIASEVVVPAGDTIVVQGERGDRYYVIAEGLVEVLEDDVRVNTMGRGDGFGEIALLHEIPRTATVRALSETWLIAIEREPFLVALTGHAPTLASARQVAAERRHLNPDE
ncbi:cyclic nucleotide-binding domain-containing protein, partial [Ilumatobacter sp.]|uniref:cyclic nucleotide-binding domain-containing protein n=1 Tax=Ilumatobacter sp. TaxID=1967498 RepID=UPI003C3D34E8